MHRARPRKEAARQVAPGARVMAIQACYPGMLAQSSHPWVHSLAPCTHPPLHKPPILSQAGQQVRAKVMHVDAAKARVFLSMRRTAPNPLLETLDSLVTSAAAASQAAPGSGGAGAADAGAAVAQLDQRPVLGDLSEAVAFAGLLRATRGVHSVELGVRLQSRAASQARAGPRGARG